MLKLKNYKSKLEKLLHVTRRTFISHPKFCLYTGASADVSKNEEYSKVIYCVPMATTAVYPFSFPFSGKGNLMSALNLKFRSLIGAGASALDMTVQITEQTKHETRGAVWFTSKAEIESFSGLDDEATFIPIPLVFLSEVEGTGLVIWRENNSAYAVWAENYEPKIYRCFSSLENSLEENIKWMRSYAQSVGGDIAPENVRVFSEGQITEQELQEIGEATFAAAPSIATLEFRNGTASIEEQQSKLADALLAGLKLATGVGIFFLVSSLILLGQSYYKKSEFASSPSLIYRLAMNEESRAPLSSVTKQLRAVSMKGTQMSFEGVLGGIAAAWKTMPSNMQLNSIRYGLERTELEGQARSADEIQKLRDEFGKNGFSVRLGDVQQLPGASGGLRFTLNLMAGENRSDS